MRPGRGAAQRGPAANPTRQRAARKALVVEGRGSLAPRYLCVAPAAGRLGVGAERQPGAGGLPLKPLPDFCPMEALEGSRGFCPMGARVFGSY